MSTPPSTIGNLWLLLIEADSGRTIDGIPLISRFAYKDVQSGWLKDLVLQGCPVPKEIVDEKLRVFPVLSGVKGVFLPIPLWLNAYAFSLPFRDDLQLDLPDQKGFARFIFKNAVKNPCLNEYLVPSDDGRMWLYAREYGKDIRQGLNTQSLIFSEAAWNDPMWQALVKRVATVVLDEERTKLEPIREEFAKRLRETEAQLEENQAKRRKFGLA